MCLGGTGYETSGEAERRGDPDLGWAGEGGRRPMGVEV